MRKIFILMIVTCFFYSCSKNTNNSMSATPDYLGIYTSSTKDTVKVTQSGNYLKFVYSTYVSIPTPVPPPTVPTMIGVWGDNYVFTFDSVRVASDLSFTDNEFYSQYRFSTGSIFPLPPPANFQGVNTGTGIFSTNVMNFHFSVFNFTGIKL